MSRKLSINAQVVLPNKFDLEKMAKFGNELVYVTANTAPSCTTENQTLKLSNFYDYEDSSTKQNVDNKKLDLSNIQNLEDIIQKTVELATPQQSVYNTQQNSDLFEQIAAILKESNTNDQTMPKSKRIASEAEVSTRQNVLLRLEEREDQKNKPKDKKNRNKTKINRNKDKKNHPKHKLIVMRNNISDSGTDKNKNTVEYEEEDFKIVDSLTNGRRRKKNYR